MRDRPYVKYNEQTMIDYSCFLINRIDRGMKNLGMKDEDRIRTLGAILIGYVEADIQIEAKIQKCIQKGKTAFEIGTDTSKKQNNKILKKTTSSEEVMYV